MYYTTHHQTLYLQLPVLHPHPIPPHQALQDCLIQMTGYIYLLPIDASNNWINWCRIISYQQFLWFSVRLVILLPLEYFPCFGFTLESCAREPGRNVFQQGNLVLMQIFSKTQSLTVHTYNQEGSRSQSNEQCLHNLLCYGNIWIIVC